MAKKTINRIESYWNFCSLPITDTQQQINVKLKSDLYHPYFIYIFVRQMNNDIELTTIIKINNLQFYFLIREICHS